MTEEAEELRLRLRKKNAGQLAFNAVMVLLFGFALLVAAIWGSDIARAISVNQEAIQGVQDSLKVTCEAAKNTPGGVPAAARQDCLLAQQNKIPEVVQGVDNPDPNDPENQEEEIQDLEIQDSETQDPDQNDPDPNDPDPNDPDPVDDPDPDDPENQEEEIQETEIQDPELQNPGCPDGYVQSDFHYYGPNGVDDEEGSPEDDDEDWLLCKKVG